MLNRYLIKTVEVDDQVITQLRESGLSKKMKSLENCEFLVFEEDNQKIIGASGVGGLLNVQSIQLLDEAQGKGLGKVLLVKAIEEAKNRGYSFLLGSRDIENSRVTKLHEFVGYIPCVRIHYSPEITTEIIILPFNFKGRIIENILKLLNNKFSIIVFAIVLKIFKSSLFKKVVTYPPEEFPDPNISYMIKNFEKIKS